MPINGLSVTYCIRRLVDSHNIIEDATSSVSQNDWLEIEQRLTEQSLNHLI
jgi:hypothetical protein